MCFGNVRNEQGEAVAGSALGLGFHTDMSYRPHPCELTLLRAVEVPRVGGDTHFVSMVRLHEELDEETRAVWASLEAEHVTESSYYENAPDRRSVHPLVTIHPDSGRPLVYACPAYMRRVIGLPEPESRRILERLVSAMDPPDVVHRWQPGDVLIWDNRAVLHRATPHDSAHTRLLWRVSVRLGVGEAFGHTNVNDPRSRRADR
jgi:taurine dioxygenase